MHPMLNIAIRAARKAGSHLVKSIDKMDPEQNSDAAVETVIREATALMTQIIHNAYPDHCVGSRGTELLSGYGHDVQWIIQPLDGVKNYVKGLPHVAASIAIRINDKTELACVYDPILNELYTAQRGKGAQRNNQRIRVSQIKELHHAVLALGDVFTTGQLPVEQRDTLDHLLTTCADFRRIGCTSLQLCYLASGRIDAVVDSGFRSFDLLAAELIAKEAGAIFTDMTGGMEYYKLRHVMAANSGCIKYMLQKPKV